MKRSIAYLLLPLNVDYGDEDVEFVFHYQDKIVFMTYSWLLLFDEKLFKVDHRQYPTEYSVDKQIVEKHGFKMPVELVEKRRNCLWRPCGEKLPLGKEKPLGKETEENLEKIDEIFRQKKKDSSLALSLHMALNVVLLIIILALFVVIQRLIRTENSAIRGSQIDSKFRSAAPYPTTSSIVDESRTSKMESSKASSTGTKPMFVSQKSPKKV